MTTITETAKRVRRNTPRSINEKIDLVTLENIRKYAHAPNQEVRTRLKQLDREWDIERTLEVNMAALALTGIALSIWVSRKWLILPSVVLGFFIQHAIQGWCPPLPLIRAFKVRTRTEIDQEKFALKAMRGDLNRVKTAEKAFKAAQKY